MGLLTSHSYIYSRASVASLKEWVAEVEAVAKWSRAQLEHMQKTMDKDQEDLQMFQRDTTYVVHSKRLRLYHRSSRSETLWAPVGSVEAHGSPSAKQARQTWSVVAETLKAQDRDFVATLVGADQAAEQGKEVDVFPAMYDCIKLAVDALSNNTG